MSNQTPLGVRGDKRFPTFPKAPYYPPAGRSTGEGGLPQRKEATFSFLTDDEGYSEGVFLFDDESGMDLLQITCYLAGRLRVYAREEDRDLDRDRDPLVSPTTPCLLDVEFGANAATATIRLFDGGVEGGVHCYNREAPAQARLYYIFEINTESFIDGFAVNTYYDSAADGEHTGLDDGYSAQVIYGLDYNWAVDPNPYDYDFDHDGNADPPGGGGSAGFDRYWVWCDSYGIRCRSNKTTVDGSSLAFYSAQTNSGDHIEQLCAFKHDPILAPNYNSDWTMAHAYFRGSGLSYSPQGCVLAGVRRYAYGEGVAFIAWVDVSGVLQVLDLDGTSIDVSADVQLWTTCIGHTVKVYVDGVLYATGTVPDAIFDSGRRDVGVYMDSDPQADFAKQYGGPRMKYWGVREGDAPAVSITLGYVPNEKAGGTVTIPLEV